MFSLAFGVMRFENYEDWTQFFQNVKKLIVEKEVIIILNRHPSLLCSVLEIFG